MKGIPVFISVSYTHVSVPSSDKKDINHDLSAPLSLSDSVNSIQHSHPITLKHFPLKYQSIIDPLFSKICYCIYMTL